MHFIEPYFGFADVDLPRFPFLGLPQAGGVTPFSKRRDVASGSLIQPAWEQQDPQGWSLKLYSVTWRP
jgi:hypothetical protein